MILYFSKVNLSTIDLLKMYEKKELFEEMRKNILSFLETNTVFEVEQIYKDDQGETHLVTTKY